MESNLTKKKNAISLWISTGYFDWLFKTIAFALIIGMAIGVGYLVYKFGIFIMASIFDIKSITFVGYHIIGFVVGISTIFLIGVALLLAFIVIYCIISYILDLILVKKILNKVQYLPLTKEELAEANIPDPSLSVSLDNLSNYMKNLFSFRDNINHIFFFPFSMENMLFHTFLETYEAFAKAYPDIVEKDKKLTSEYAKSHSSKLAKYLIYKDENHTDKIDEILTTVKSIM